ncbi:MAG: rhamnogalacturonan acetylesterase [Paenibacillus sp.]|jgi:lysophospholipase L1-like esterase|nr:rhamnogalacturonan acetylesterase [Paenibacillus sp.]
MLKPIQLFIAGDSTSAYYPPEREPLTGWGQVLGHFFQPSVVIRNEAVSGCSSKSFREAGYMRPIEDSLQPGDYLFIQFGHNDEKEDPDRHTDPGSSFPASLQIYLNTAIAKGAFPVLITPVERRSITAEGEFTSTHDPYADAVRKLGREQNVPLLDLCDVSLKLYREWGVERSKELFNWLEPGQSSAFPDGAKDNTHFSGFGAEVIAGIVVNLIEASKLELRHYLISK